MIDVDNKLPNNITLKKFAILMTCVTNVDGKCYPKMFLEKALLVKKVRHLTRWRDWCIHEDEKKCLEPVFTDKVGK